MSEIENITCKYFHRYFHYASFYLWKIKNPSHFNHTFAKPLCNVLQCEKREVASFAFDSLKSKVRIITNNYFKFIYR